MTNTVLETQFAERFGRQPSVTLTVPGVLNLLGEPSGFSGLPSLGFATSQSLVVAAAPRDDRAVHVHSLALEPAAEFHRGIRDQIVHSAWHRHVAGALAELADVAPALGADILIGGDLPYTGGLASSSALSLSLVAALSAVWGAPMASEALHALTTRTERHTGIETSGGETAVLLRALASNAVALEGSGLDHALLPLPPGLAFVVGYSGQPANVRDAIIERVVGARIAASMVADEVGIDLDNPPTLGQVATIDVVDILVDGLPEKVSAQEVAHGAQVDVARLVQLGAATYDHMAKVPVKRIARHLLDDAARVEPARQALAAGDLIRFGVLLNDSHNSLREDFRSSTPALDRVAAAMRKAGAFGARITGVGFGGHVFAACPPDAVPAVIAAAEAATGGPAFATAAVDGYHTL